MSGLYSSRWIWGPVTQEWIDLCKEECTVLSDVSVALLQEQLAREIGDAPWTEEQIDRRRAELYMEVLKKAGIAIIRVDPE